MIEVALRKLPDQQVSTAMWTTPTVPDACQGTIKQISDIIAQDYKDMLNWKSERCVGKSNVRDFFKTQSFSCSFVWCLQYVSQSSGVARFGSQNPAWVAIQI